mgnify:CR=1 FL=1
MMKDIKTERRWLRSVIIASAEPLPSFPWMRGNRRRPADATPTNLPLRKLETGHHGLFHRGSAAAH